MRRAILLSGLTLFALAGSARAQDESPTPEAAAEAAPTAEEAPPPAAAVAPESKFRVGIAVLPMLMGKGGGGDTGDITWGDLKTAYGVGLSFGYKVIAGLSVGIAPQILLNVKGKENDPYDASKEWDVMARIAYEYTVIPKLDVYGELLPGYSIIQLASGRSYAGVAPSNPKGFVIGFGAGAAYDVTDQFYANLGIGYQMGFGSFSTEMGDQAFRTKFLRIALGGGMKF
jgi:opacity protein-like surface antigen